MDPDTPGTGLYGSFGTGRLQTTAATLRQLGAPRRLVHQAFVPFIIRGRAEWTNSWGAPRRDGGSRVVRAHEGQDVFCDRGAPVLATVPGTIEFDSGGLGGKVARLYMRDGAYLYYAHLEDFNTDRFRNGDRVRPGDVIGYCGSTGNAASTAPHVHFGLYRGGVAYDPMAALVNWLEAAEGRSRRLIRTARLLRLEGFGADLLARRFGVAWEPDLTFARNEEAGYLPIETDLLFGGAEPAE